MAHTGDRKGVHTVYLCGNLRVGYYLEELGVDWRIILRWLFRKWDGEGAWTGFIWLRLGTGSGHL
jgi:hypothetical protein